ncbi:hypothetical protein GGX14DRAFT_518547 [Mycena pura]|uniref:Short-chain dehydrogenase/reductase family protein n=1 Tax=Mycena pura TaxID=153505 RepID=A0AAD6VS07_9AGAR|nr:hypothetical protein GGX14DRAFT_518547 [Mycena pura]
MPLPTFTFSTTADEVATALTSEIEGKNLLITGTSIGGIGFELARVVAKHANLVVITGYDLERLKLSEEAIKKDVPTANIRPLVLNLSSPAAVRKAATEVNTYPEPLHVLINNAADTGGTLRITDEGFDSQMATSHFGPFLLTKLLAPKLLATRTTSFVPRVVFVSSMAQKLGPGINFATLRRPDPAVEQNLLLRYHEVKCANVLMAIELVRRAQGKLLAYSLDPGGIYTNSMTKEAVVPAMQAAGYLTEDGKPNTATVKWKTIPQGAATTLVAAFDPRLNDKPGAFLVDCNESNKDLAPHCSDPANAEKLWNMTEEIVGERFNI